MERLTTARVALLDARNRVLLVRCVDPGSGDSVWVTPGGSIERSETAADAARRELAEETGITDARFGPCVYVRENRFGRAGIEYSAHETIFVARIDSASPRASGMDDEGEIVAEVRWWSSEDLSATDEEVSPADVATLLTEWAQVQFRQSLLGGAEPVDA